MTVSDTTNNPNRNANNRDQHNRAERGQSELKFDFSDMESQMDDYMIKDHDSTLSKDSEDDDTSKENEDELDLDALANQSHLKIEKAKSQDTNSVSSDDHHHHHEE